MIEQLQSTDYHDLGRRKWPPSVPMKILQKDISKMRWLGSASRKQEKRDLGPLTLLPSGRTARRSSRSESSSTARGALPVSRLLSKQRLRDNQGRTSRAPRRRSTMCNSTAGYAIGSLLVLLVVAASCSWQKVHTLEYALDYDYLTQHISAHTLGSGLHFLGGPWHRLIRYPGTLQNMQFSTDDSPHDELHADGGGLQVVLEITFSTNYSWTRCTTCTRTSRAATCRCTSTWRAISSPRTPRSTRPTSSSAQADHRHGHAEDDGRLLQGAPART